MDYTKRRLNQKNVGKTVGSDWPRLQRNLQDLLDDIATKQQQMDRNNYANISNNFYYYNKAQANTKKYRV